MRLEREPLKTYEADGAMAWVCQVCLPDGVIRYIVIHDDELFIQQSDAEAAAKGIK